MSSAAMPPMPDPSGGAPASPAAVNPTSPAAVAPAPASPAPGMQQGTQQVIQVVQGLRSIAKAFPAAAGEISQINDLMRQVLSKMMASQQTGEPAAPPSAG